MASSFRGSIPPGASNRAQGEWSLTITFSAISGQGQLFPCGGPGESRSNAKVTWEEEIETGGGTTRSASLQSKANYASFAFDACFSLADKLTVASIMDAKIHS